MAVPRVDAVLALVIVLLDVEAGCVTRSLSCSCAPFSGAHSLPAFLVDCAAAVAEAVAEAVAAAPPLTPRAVRGMSSSTLHVYARGSGRGRERKREGEREREGERGERK